ncbi:hypothetical protein NEOLEDRAFT_929006 [Neolentinus lepideus HHB14362 ss-1]|uniref:Ams2/SPT21 N-terminal domain-containing protein n=1 Tax=Neolentinus lepideus HHB14362 ss-1 TaxID=1314782 RepID=A0A165NM49_9AGAM|nr:hypothetical protein NEOLEDRAFT_929006 [Neolentinus lepideus HHB14362 ss-1]
MAFEIRVRTSGCALQVERCRLQRCTLRRPCTCLLFTSTLMDAITLPLRVLYTINSSPQYILARSQRKTTVNLVQRAASTSVQDRTAPTYATVALKACVDVICRCSPELAQFKSRDFSIYLLDPLEASASTSPFAPAPTKQGVAVGMGLLSWAMATEDDEDVQVTGTVISTGHGETLELVFALRERPYSARSLLFANPAPLLASHGRLYSPLYHPDHKCSGNLRLLVLRRRALLNPLNPPMILPPRRRPLVNLRY